MPITTDSQFVQDKFDEAFGVDHDKRESFKDHYKNNQNHFHVHLPQQDWKGDGPVKVLESPDHPHRLVSIHLAAKLDGTPEQVMAQLAEIRKSLDALVREGEQVQLFVEDAPMIDTSTGHLKYEAKGTIGPRP